MSIPRLPHISALLPHGDQCRAVGTRAKALRKQRRLSRHDLAAMSGVSTATIFRFENEGVITLSAMLKIAQSLDALAGFNSLFEPTAFASLDEFERGGA